VVGWRSLTAKNRQQILLDIYDMFRERTGPGSIGHSQYGDEFQGDPLEQALEEAVDLVFYLIMLRRKQRRHSK